MKNLFLILFFTASFQAYSQVTEGYFQYSISVEALDTTLEAKQKAGMLRNSKMEIYFAKNMARIDFTMGSMYKTKTIINQDSSKSLSIIESGMGKFATIKPLDEMDFSRPVMDSNALITYSEDTRKILGYNCQKITIEQKRSVTIYWITDEIKLDNIVANVVDPNIPGFPMYFSKIEDGVELIFQASNLENFVADKAKVFSIIPPADCKLMSEPIE
jgi:GLPGLI family protein|tara:strand:- start:3248 stop:3895 length:648 start_codon:yes stop_codon:yes gene_type:complete